VPAKFTNVDTGPVIVAGPVAVALTKPASTAVGTKDNTAATLASAKTILAKTLFITTDLIEWDIRSSH